MKNRLSLTIAFSGPPAAIDHNWIRLVQIGLKPSQATIGETADLVDAAYRTDPCNKPAQTTPVDQQGFQAAVKKTFDLSLCDIDPDGRTHVQLQVILNDPAEPYALRLDPGATIIQSAAVDEEVSLRLPVSKQSSLVLPYPVTGGSPIFGWAGDTAYGPGGLVIAPDIARDGNTLVFDADYTGIVTAEYLTRYFQVDITFPGDQDCRARCFSMGLAAELDLQRPESQGTLNDWEKYCNPQTKWVFRPPEGVTCYEEVNLSYRCECDTNQESRSITIRRGVPCPDGFITWGIEPGDYKIGDKYEIAGYEYCQDLAVNYGSQDLSDPDFYKQMCCNPPPQGLALPHCATVTLKNPGGAALENGEDYYRKLYGPNTRFVPVAPADGDCGTMEITQDVYQHNCCDGVIPIYFDEADSTEIIADNSKGLITVTGGRAPYHWQVRGSGFWANEACTWRDVETDTPFLWIYTKDSCGPCYVWCNDGCSDQSWLIRSAVGQWVQINSDDPNNCMGIQLDCGAATGVLDTVNTCISKQYRIDETYHHGSFGVCLSAGLLTQDKIDVAVASACDGVSLKSCAFSSLTDWTPCAGANGFWRLRYLGQYSYCAPECFGTEACHYVVEYAIISLIDVYEWRC